MGRRLGEREFKMFQDKEAQWPGHIVFYTISPQLFFEVL